MGHRLDPDPNAPDAFRRALEDTRDQAKSRNDSIRQSREVAVEAAKAQTPEQRTEARERVAADLANFKAKHCPPETPLDRMRRCWNLPK